MNRSSDVSLEGKCVIAFKSAGGVHNPHTPPGFPRLCSCQFRRTPTIALFRLTVIAAQVGFQLTGAPDSFGAGLPTPLKPPTARDAARCLFFVCDAKTENRSRGREACVPHRREYLEGAKVSQRHQPNSPESFVASRESGRQRAASEE